MQPRLQGMELLNNQMLNKGTAFTNEERASLGLHGLLPPQVETLNEQVIRAYGAYKRKDDDLERHIYLRALEDTNEVLFYRILLDHIEEMTPIVYPRLLRWAVSNSARSTAARAVSSSRTRCVTRSPRFFAIAPIHRSTSS